MQSYDEDEIYQNIILPLFKTYSVEFSGFADSEVAVTREAGQGAGPGWTARLVEEGYISLPSSTGKYIELERSLSSIVAFRLLQEGSLGAYRKFTSIQKEHERLSFESFSELHCQIANLCGDLKNSKFFEAILVYSDLGKTPVARRRAHSYGISDPDHDDWIEHVLSQEDSAVVSEIMPSFSNFTFEEKAELKMIVGSLKVHLGHVLHLEGGVHMFDKLQAVLERGEVTLENFQFAFLIQLCDVAASQAQASNEGFAALTENTFQAYQMLWQCLKYLFQTHAPVKALEVYIKLRGEKIGLPAEDEQHTLLIRFACMLRLYTEEEGLVLKGVSKQLTEEDWNILQGQFGMKEGINSWTRNPTYIPAVLVNLFRKQTGEEELSQKLSRALQGAVCISKILQHYENSVGKFSEIPLCFNSLAGVAATHPEYFDSTHFSVESLQYDEKNNVIYNPDAQRLTVAFGKY